MIVQWSDGTRIHQVGGFSDYEAARAWAERNVPCVYRWTVLCDR